MFEKYDAYKDSSVEWIGKIPTDWFNERLGTILEPISIKGNADKDLLSITREKGVILRDVEDDSENHNFIPDDLSNYKLIEKGQFGMNKMKAWQGSYGVSPYTGIVSPAYYIFRFIKPIYPDFFHWAIRSKTYISFFGSASDGVRIGQWDLSKDRMKNIPFVFPNIDSQKKIVEFIQDKAGKIDQAIVIKEQQIALLNERKQIVIQKAVTQGLEPNVPMKDSGMEWIGEIPEHWNTITKLKHIASLKGRQGWQGLKADEYIDDGPYVVSSAHFYGLDINWDKCPHVSRERYEMDAHIQLNIGDILLMKDGAKMGKMAYISNLPDLACLNSHLLLIRSLKTQDEFFFDSKYMLYFMLSEKFQDYVQVKGTGTTFMGISQESIGNFPIALPSLEEQVQIASFLDQRMLELEKGKDLLLTQIEKLKEYKTTLINDAVTGKIKVA